MLGRSLKATERTRSRETVYYSPLGAGDDTAEDDSEETDELLRPSSDNLKWDYAIQTGNGWLRMYAAYGV